MAPLAPSLATPLRCESCLSASPPSDDVTRGYQRSNFTVIRLRPTFSDKCSGVAKEGAKGAMARPSWRLTQWAPGDAKAPAADPLTQLGSHKLAKGAPILEPWGPIETRGPGGWDGSNSVYTKSRCK